MMNPRALTAFRQSGEQATRTVRRSQLADRRNRSCSRRELDSPLPVELQGYYADITQLVLLNPKFV